MATASPITEVQAPPRAEVLNALSIDVEDYYHVSAFEKVVPRSRWAEYESRVVPATQRILDRLEGCGVRATFFVLGWVARRHPELVRSLVAAGHEVGSHGYEHRLVYEQTPEEFRDDLLLARRILEDQAGRPVRSYRAPSFSITARSLWALDVLIDEGFLHSSSIYPVYHDRYGIPGAPLEPHRIQRPGGSIWEFPPPVWQLCRCPVPVGGGGYFRLLPYGVTRRGLRAINRRGRPFIAYLHPWELDPAQPRLPVGRLRGWRHYLNLHRTEPRLGRLLQDFSFGTLTEALDRYVEPSTQPRRAA